LLWINGFKESLGGGKMNKRHRYKMYLCGICVLACVFSLFSVLLNPFTRICLANDEIFTGDIMQSFVDEHVVEQVLKSLPVTFEGFHQEHMSIWSPWVLSPSNTNTLRVFYHPISWELDISPLDNNEWIDGFRENAKYLFEHIEDLDEVSFSFFFTPFDLVFAVDRFDFRFTTSRLGVAEGEMLVQRNEQYNEFNTVDVIIELTDITSTGLSVSLINNTDKQFMYGVGFVLYRYVNGDWEKVDYITEDWGFVDIGNNLEPYSISDPRNIDWEWLYGNLDKGIYRFNIEILDVRAPGDFDTLPMYTVFEVE
jgi:hypothetical protein